MRYVLIIIIYGLTELLQINYGHSNKITFCVCPRKYIFYIFFVARNKMWASGCRILYLRRPYSSYMSVYDMISLSREFRSVVLWSPSLVYCILHPGYGEILHIEMQLAPWKLFVMKCAPRRNDSSNQVTWF